MDGELTLEFLGRISSALGHGDPRERDKVLLSVVMDAYQVGLDEGRSHGEALMHGLSEALRPAGRPLLPQVAPPDEPFGLWTTLDEGAPALPEEDEGSGEAD